MVDIHSHVLPGIDDGAKDMEMSLEMLRIAASSGIKKIIATPHYYRGYYENKYEDVYRLAGEVRNIAYKSGIDIEIIPGQEVLLDKYTLQLYREGIIRGIAGTKYILIELPMNAISKDTLDIIYELKIEGVRPIIVHPERYMYIQEKPSTINQFIEEGCLFQINGPSIKGIFGRSVQKTAEILIQHGVCDFIASDAHTVRRRSPIISDALELTKRLNLALVQDILNNADKLLNNEDIHSRAQNIKEKRSFFNFLKGRY